MIMTLILWKEVGPVLTRYFVEFNGSYFYTLSKQTAAVHGYIWLYDDKTDVLVKKKWGEFRKEKTNYDDIPVDECRKLWDRLMLNKYEIVKCGKNT